MIKDEYQEAIDYLFSFQRFGIKLGLSNITLLLEKLGNPHHKLRFVHVAGTNGKGTTSKLIESALAAAGYKVGCFTSPHLIRFNERITINSKLIANQRLVVLVNRLKKAISEILKDPENNHPTYFEAATALAILHFAERQVDLAILEVGMGGRFDATNVITPLASLITNVTMDHHQYLGPTVEVIAKEKAGIIKNGIPVFSTETSKSVRAVIRGRAAEVGAQVIWLGPVSEAVTFHQESMTESMVDLRTATAEITNLRIGIGGKHQANNALLAFGTLVHLRTICGFGRLNDGAIRQGFSTLKWPGRLQRVSTSPPLCSMAPITRKPPPVLLRR